MTLFNRAGVEHQPTGHTDKGKPYRTYGTSCSRCGGLGGGEQWRYTGWTCYDCGGSGRGPSKTEPLYTAEKLEKLRAAQAKRDAKKEAERDAQIAEQIRVADEKRAVFAAAHPEVMNWVEANKGLDENGFENFAMSLADGIKRFGGLTERQLDAVQRVMAREKANNASRHLGTIGERREFDLTVERVFDFQISRFPLIVSYTNICRDRDGNVVVYKGSHGWAKGDELRVKATVKDHADYKGVKQTIINRPKELA